jgi:hypothetical protein
MRNFSYTRLGLFLLFCLPGFMSFGNTERFNGFRVLTSNADGKTVMEFTMNSYSLMAAPGLKGFSVIKAGGGAALLEAGAPDLLQFSASLVIPDLGNMRFRILESETVLMQDIHLAPSKGNLPRTINPADVPYQFGAPYSADAWYPSNQVAMRTPYIFRDLRGQAMSVSPFRYNPVRKELEVTKRLIIEVYPDDSALPGVNEIMRLEAQPVLTSDFMPLYERRFINLPWVQYQPSPENSKMLVICHNAWMPLMQPFVNWKRQRGMEVELVDVTTAGSSAAGISQFISSRYQSDSISFVLLVGDAAYCPTPTPNGDAADPSYGFIVGADAYAEVFIGRFSAESDADVITQVQRTIAYERDASPADVSIGRGVVIGSDQGPGDDNEMDWEHAVNMRTDLLAFTYTDVAELYDGTHSSTIDAAGDPGPADLFNLFQQGIGVMTYTGHGSSTSCSTTGLSNGDVQNMTNTGRLPFIWSVACVNGDFASPGSGPCFAETFLRAQVNGQATGAVATLMSSINQSWNPPMDAQDEMVDLLVQAVPGHQKFTFGGISVNGCMHMNDQYGQAGDDMTTTWHCFGDPSLLVRTEAPTAMAVSHPPVLISGSDSLSVLCSRSDALISLTHSSGSMGLSVAGVGPVVFSCPGLIAPDTLWITVTAFNAQTYVGYVLVIPAGVPYLDGDLSGLIETGTQVNGQVDFNESITQDIVLDNFGSADATAVAISVTTTDPYISITSASIQPLPVIAAGSSVTLAQAFGFDVANGVPDQHPVTFQISCIDGAGSVWASTTGLIVNAPAPVFGPISVNDSQGGNANGLLEIGETATLEFSLQNAGHSILPAGSVLISSSFQSLTLLCGGTLSHPDVLPGQSVQLTCQASLTGNVAIGTTFGVDAALLNTAYPQQASFSLSAGEILEDFETNDFTRFAWNMAGNQPWVTTNLQPYQGTTCAMSGVITDNESSELNISLLSLADDSVSFHYRTSTEQGWDFLRFFVDGIQQGQWSGIAPWQYASFALPAGQHDLRFVYTKDDIVSAGDDRVWLDNIRLPFGTTISGLSDAASTAAQLMVYPNPGSGLFRVLASDFNAERWMLSDLTGRIVLTGNSSGMNGNEIQIDGSILPSGHYLLGLYGTQGRRQARICVVNP